MKVNVSFLDEIINYNESILNPPIANQIPSRKNSSSKPNDVKVIFSQKLTRFDVLYVSDTPNGIGGYQSAKKWFLSLTCTPLPSSSIDNTLNENQFLCFMEKLTNLEDYKILELFDLFDYDNTGKICFPEFFLLISLVAARESAKCTHFLWVVAFVNTDYCTDIITAERFIPFCVVETCTSFQKLHLPNFLYWELCLGFQIQALLVPSLTFL